MKILVTGATGYVGGRLVTRLLEHGHLIRCMVRDPGRLQGRAWQDKVEVVQGDVLDPASLLDALNDIEVAYYLVHSMSGGQDFHSRDLEAARTFGQNAKMAGVKRIIYLGGLGDPKSKLSEHLLSRHQTGDALRESGLPVTEFQAAVIVGSGSISFEMIRYLSERVPIMICPQWVYTRVQPISIRNVLDYMAAALTTPESQDRIIEIGGTDVLTYGDMMMQYSQVRGLKRWLISVPFLSPQFSYYWVHLVTPIPANIARPLIQGLRNEVIVRNNLAREIFPNIRLMGYTEAVQAALVKLEAREVETVWSDALVTTLGHKPPVMMTTQQGMVWEHRQLLVHTDSRKVFCAFTSLGGKTGWLYLNWMWQLRGLIDRLAGGVGMRRGRVIPRTCGPAMRSISGEWKQLKMID